MNEIVERLAAIWENETRLVFLGVGSPLRADDSVGLFIVEELEKGLAAPAGKELRFYLGESAPENFSGAIREFGPSTVIIFDAAEFGAAPGTFRLIEADEIGGASFSTHMLPLHVLANYLTASAGCRILVIGVQPKLLEFGYPLTPKVQSAAAGFVRELAARVG
jgi:hydrogenase 3 maturation protease